MSEFSALGSMPTEASSGDIIPLALTELSVQYPPADFSLVLSCRLAAGDAIEVTFTDDGGKHSGDLDLTAATSGVWSWSIRATDSNSKTLVVARGSLRVHGDPSAGTVQTHAERTLAALEAVIENRATIDQQSYSIAGRSLTRMTVEELLKWRAHYSSEVAAERRRAAGRQSRNTTLARFSF